jgi:hypothetical protein
LDNAKDTINLNLTHTVVTDTKTNTSFSMITGQEYNDSNKVVPLVEDKSQMNIAHKYRALLLKHFKILDFSNTTVVNPTFSKVSVNTNDLTDYLQNKYSNVVDKGFIGLTTS